MKVRINKRFLAALISTGLVFSLSACSSEQNTSVDTSSVSQESVDDSQSFNQNLDDSVGDLSVSEEEPFDCICNWC